MTYLNDASTRIEAMCEQMIANSDAMGFAVWKQEGFPYFTTRLTDFRQGEFYGDDNSQRIYTFEIYYHRGYITQGQTGEVEQAIFTDLPVIQEFFEENPGLTSTAYPTELIGLDPLETMILPSQAVVNLGKGSDGQTEVLGSVIRLQVTFNIGINPK